MYMRMQFMMLLVLICVSVVMHVHQVSAETQDTSENLSVQLLAEKMQKMENEMKYMRKDNHDLKSKDMLMDKELENVKVENQQLKQQTANMKNAIAKLEMKHNYTFVSFMAYPSETKSYTGGDHVMFDVAIRNYGSAYNTEFSVFQCPVSGYYIFFFNLFTQTSDRMYARVKMGNSAEAALPQAYSPLTDADNGSSLSVTYCSQGEAVWVEATTVDDNRLFGDDRSHFTGALLYPE